jgi:hypothetical protein
MFPRPRRHGNRCRPRLDGPQKLRTNQSTRSSRHRQYQQPAAASDQPDRGDRIVAKAVVGAHSRRRVPSSQRERADYVEPGAKSDRRAYRRRRVPSWRCGRPAANACSTKGGVRLRAIASVPRCWFATGSSYAGTSSETARLDDGASRNAVSTGAVGLALPAIALHVVRVGKLAAPAGRERHSESTPLIGRARRAMSRPPGRTAAPRQLRAPREPRSSRSLARTSSNVRDAVGSGAGQIRWR